MATRKAALAGRWYPNSEEVCRRDIEGLFEAQTPALSGIAGIVPHAGWMFSGSVATTVIRALANSDPSPELLLLFGTHMSPRGRPHISRASAFETPLGPIKAAESLASQISDELGLGEDPADSSWGGGDNTVEVQFPLIKYFMPEIELAIISPSFSAEAIRIGAVAAKAAKKRGVTVAVLGSTDLTHYGPNYGFSPKGSGTGALKWVKEKNDARMIEKILEMNPEGVIDEAMVHHNACAPGAVAAAISAAKELGAQNSTLLEYRTSYDVHPNDSFVGYAGVVMI